jgi:hypothetical protein
MERYIHYANIEHYRRLLAESKRDPSRDEDRHNMLLTLLAQEEAKDTKPRNGWPLAAA